MPRITRNAFSLWVVSLAKFGSRLALGAGLSLLAALAWGNDFGAEMESQGHIEKLSFGEQQLQVGGRNYQVGPGVQVEIGGTYGAFTLLQPGMKVYLRFVQYADGRKEVVQIRELGAGVRMEES